MVKINELSTEEDMDGLLEALLNKHLSLSAVDPSNIDYYRTGLRERLQHKRDEVGMCMYVKFFSRQLLFVVGIVCSLCA